ncbi:MAG: hypothetical protein ND807_15840 [Vicinamibacterales bacterium]|nr:hypothetical protein [Vicinamibacterales bacterium]
MKRTGTAIFLISLTVWVVFHPALNRVFAGDQLWYFAELQGDTSFTRGAQFYDYAASRRYWKGDEALFRPLLFLWLAAENTAFSYHHVWWNTANLAAHAAAGFFLYRLLMAVRPSGAAFGAALLFVVLKPPLELVLWNHLGGYILACVCLLIGLLAFVELTLEVQSRQRGRATGLFVCAMTAGGLFYEVLVPIALTAAGLIFLVERRRGAQPTLARLARLTTPVWLFVILYIPHASVVSRFQYVHEGGVHQPGNFLGMATTSALGLWAWMSNLALPSAVTFSTTAFNRIGKTFDVGAAPPLAVALDAMLLGILLVGVAMSVTRAQIRRTWPLLVLVTVSMGSYAAVIALGRPLGEMKGASYYLYFPALLLTIAAYALVDLKALSNTTRWVAGTALAGAIAVHAAGSRTTASQIGRVNEPASRLLTRVARFVEANKSRPGFRFVILAHPPALDPSISLLEGYPDEAQARTRTLHATEILFARYYSDRASALIFDARQATTQ